VWRRMSVCVLHRAWLRWTLRGLVPAETIWLGFIARTVGGGSCSVKGTCRKLGRPGNGRPYEVIFIVSGRRPWRHETTTNQSRSCCRGMGLTMGWTGCKRELSERPPALLQTTSAQGLESNAPVSTTPSRWPCANEIDQRQHLCLPSTLLLHWTDALTNGRWHATDHSKFVLLVPYTIGAVVPSERSCRWPGPQ
jgi:hypothetical protein